MKKISLTSLVLLSVGLVACGKEGDFKKAINTKLSQQPVCLDLSTNIDYNSGVNQDDFKKIEDKTKGMYVISQHYDKSGKNTDWSQEQTKEQLNQFDVLTSVGLLTKASESLPTYDWNKKPDGGYYIYTIYTLTDAGKATAIKVEASSMSKALFGDSGQRIFCYASPEVEKIENYTEGEGMGGVHYAKVKYSYKYVNIADWATKPKVKSAFPQIAKYLDNPDKTSTMEVAKTNNGWSTDL